MLDQRFSRESRSNRVERQLSHGRFHPGNRDFAPWYSNLASNVSQDKRSSTGRRGQNRGASDLAHLLCARNNLCAYHNIRRTVDQEAGKFPMHVPPGPDALHNFLPNIASFIEVERPHLLGLLRQVKLANIDTVEGAASHD